MQLQIHLAAQPLLVEEEKQGACGGHGHDQSVRIRFQNPRSQFLTPFNIRIHVIGSGRLFPDPESLIQFPVYPFATAEPHGHYPPSGHHQQSLRLVHHVSQLPCYHEYAQNQLKFPPARWEDEPPPAYDLLFPSGTSSESGNPTPGDNNSKCQPRPV